MKNVWGYFSVGAEGGLHEYADSQFGHCFAWGEDRDAARRWVHLQKCSSPSCRSEMSFLYSPEMSTSLDTCSCKRSRQEVFTLTWMKRLNKPAWKPTRKEVFTLTWMKRLNKPAWKPTRKEVFTLTWMKTLNKPACKLVSGQKTVPKIPGLCTI